MPSLPSPTRNASAPVSSAQALVDLVHGQLTATQLERRHQRQRVLLLLLDALEGDVLNEYPAGALFGFADAVGVDLDVLVPVIAFAVDAGWLVRTSAQMEDGLSGVRFTAAGILAVEEIALALEAKTR